MQIDTSKVTAPIKAVYNGTLGTVLGQESDGRSRKWVALVAFVGLAIFACWKLKALDINVVFAGTLKLVMCWMICQSAVDAAKAIAAGLQKRA